MKTYSKVSMVFAAVVLATSAGAQQSNWHNGSNDLVWKNGTNELCWRDSSWTPATAAPGCDGALAVPASVQVPQASYTPPAPAQELAPTPVLVAPPAQKMTYATDTFFDFDKSVLKPKGKEKLDALLGEMQSMRLDVIIIVGHTDSLGSDAYNEKLSLRRSEAVGAYLVSHGVDKSRVSTKGMGESQPVADNKTKDGRAQNRRVEIEVVGSGVR